MKRTATLAALLLCCNLAVCQETADHSKFWNRQQIVWQSANAGIHVADAIQSCHTPGREVMGPWQSCAGTTVWTLSGIPLSLGAAAVLHHYHHNRLAAWAPRLFFAADAYAVGYTTSTAVRYSHRKAR